MKPIPATPTTYVLAVFFLIGTLVSCSEEVLKEVNGLEEFVEEEVQKEEEDEHFDDEDEDLLVGVLVDAVVSGAAYSTPSVSGITDNLGQYHYRSGETVSFSIGSIDLGSSTAQEQITPLELSGATNITDQKVVNRLRLLQTLDDDGVASNGIQITQSIRSAADNMTISFDQSLTSFETNTANDIATLTTSRTQGTTALVSVSSAIAHFDSVITESATSPNPITVSKNGPTDIILSSSSVAENQSSGTTVGTFSTTDSDSGDEHTYSLVSGIGDTDNSLFSISGASLLTAVSFDYETQSSYNIRVRTTDLTGETYEEVITISITDEDESSSTTTTTATTSTSSTTTTTTSTTTTTLYTQQAYLKAPNSESNDFFGNAVAIAGDTIVVAAESESSNQTTITNGTTGSSDNSNNQAGAVYVFKRSGTSWSQEAYLKAPNNDSFDQFGEHVAISGDTIVIGVKREDSNQTTITNGTTASSDNSNSNAGAVYVFKRSGSTWSQEAYLKAPNHDASDQFGSDVDIDGDTIVVGAAGESSNQTTITNGTTASSDNSTGGAGAAYVFRRSGTSWSQEAYIKAPNPDSSDAFGIAVAISGDTIVVGASSESSNQTTITNGSTASSDNSNANSGAAYVFTRSGTTWSQQAYIKAPNNGGGDLFGFPVDISGDTVVVGAQFEDSNQTTITNGSTASSDNSNSASGAVYVFKRSGATWSQEAYIKAVNGEANDEFGWSAAIDGDTIVVGSSEEDSNQTTITNGSTASSDNSNSSSGTAYVYTRSGTTWSQHAYLKTPNNDSADVFGYAVGISGSTIVVGATGESSNQTTITNGTTASSDNSNNNAGAAYVITR